MAYTLDQLSRDIRAELSQNDTDEGRKKVCEIVRRALLDDDFVAEHLTEEKCQPRTVLYEDPELGFTICGHVYTGENHGSPHDHGPAWAIYGLAGGDTTMTDWKIVKEGSDEDPALVEPVRTYEMKRGDCHYYAPYDVHSPSRSGKDVTRLVRVEGANLDHVQRSNIKAA